MQKYIYIYIVCVGDHVEVTNYMELMLLKALPEMMILYWTLDMSNLQ